MSHHIEQLVCYRHNGVIYETQKKAEAAALDLFGEELDGLYKAHAPDLAHSRQGIALAEALWNDRVKFKALLDCMLLAHDDVDNGE